MLPDTTRPAVDLPVLAGRYRLVRLVGTGGMAQVFEGVDLLLNRQVAVKVLRPALAADPELVARFLREATATAGLAHPNIAAVFDAGSDADTHFIVMEYVHGRTLRELLEARGRLPVDAAAAVTAAAAAALAAAHTHGLIHRDVKPGNIIVTADAVKVVDFGIARVADAAPITRTTSVLGTPLYLSPEQATGAPLDARSDVYGLGVCLYELLTGRPPFTGESAFAIAYQHVHASPRPPSELRPDLPPGLDAVVLRAMAKDPADRFQTAAALREAIRQAAPRVGPDRLPVQAFPPAPPATRMVPGTAVTRPGATGGGAAPKGRGRTGRARLAVLATAAVLAGTVMVAAAPGFRDGKAPAGVPAAQPALAGTQAPAATTGTLAVPYLRGLTVTAARAALRRAGLGAEPALAGRADPAVPAGLVLGTSPGAGAVVAAGTRVTLLVSTGAGAGPAAVAGTAPGPRPAPGTTPATTTGPGGAGPGGDPDGGPVDDPGGDPGEDPVDDPGGPGRGKGQGRGRGRGGGPPSQ